MKRIYRAVKASPRKATERLAAYVAARRGKPDDGAARRLHVAAKEELAARNPQGALDALGTADAASPSDVGDIQRAVDRGYALAQLGRPGESAPSHLAAGDAAEKLGWLSMGSQALQLAGDASYQSGDYKAALAAWERALKISQAIGDRAGVGTVLTLLGDAHRALGNYPKALEYDQRALKTQEERGDKAGMLNALGSIGQVQYSTGDYPKALESFERASKLAEQVGDPRSQALVLEDFALVYQAQGQFPKALEFLGRSLKIHEGLGNRSDKATTRLAIAAIHDRLGDISKALAETEEARSALESIGARADASLALRGIGDLHSSLGNYAKALGCYEEVLKVQEEIGDRAGVAATLVSFATLYDSVGASDQALEFYGKALSIHEEMGSKASVALILGDIGMAHDSLGNYAKALEYGERAQKLAEALGDDPQAAWALGIVGNAEEGLGNHAKALEVLERALKSEERIGDRLGIAGTLEDIGSVQHALGNDRKAVEYEERSLKAADEVGARETGLNARCGLARAHLALGDRAKAVARAREAIEGLSFLAGGLSEEQGAAVRERFFEVYGFGARAAAGLSAANDVSYFLESGRAGSLLESLKGRDALRGAVIPEALRAAEAEASTKGSLAVTAYRKALDGKDLSRIVALRTEMEKALDASREIVGRIQREAKAAASVLYPKADPLETLQKRLRPGEALISYGLYAEEPLAMVVTIKESRIVHLAPQKEIDAAVDGLGANNPATETDAALAALRKAVVEPLALGKDVTRVLVSPEGALSYVPFAALFDGLEVAYEPSQTTYGLLREDAAKRGDGVLALGDPDYPTKPNDRAVALVRGGLRLDPLPGTREEAKSFGSEVLLGADASEAGIRDAIGKHPRWRAVHFACHGLVDPKRPAFCSLAVTPTGDDDGFLTALEVFRSKIPADLVVLSACETGKGKIVKGEGIVGLTRAFMFAGSPRVICSLWKVNDEATRALMTKFYELWNPKDGKPGLPTSEALRKAQEFVRSQEKWKHPYYWAAWVLWGLPS